MGGDLAVSVVELVWAESQTAGQVLVQLQPANCSQEKETKQSCERSHPGAGGLTGRSSIDDEPAEPTHSWAGEREPLLTLLTHSTQ